MANSETARPRVFLDISIGQDPAGRLVIELFSDMAPRACENFHALCTGSHPPLTYRLSKFHRVIDEFMVQGGDITKGDGTGGESIYGGEFDDENLNWRPIDARGLVCMANRGANTSSSQFFITLEPSDHLNGKHTVFGHLVSGEQTLARMAEVQVDDNDCPLTDVIVSHCGELERRKKQQSPVEINARDQHYNHQDRSRRAERDSPSPDRGRGKRGRSASLDRSLSRDGKYRKHVHARRPSDSPGHDKVLTKQRNRRRSDHSVDENQRGRTRRRSLDRARATSPIAEDEDAPADRDLSMRDDSDDNWDAAAAVRGGSPSQRERRRSRSPSRSRNRDADSSLSQGYRRRRSLPNHYERRREAAAREAQQFDRRDERDDEQDQGYGRWRSDKARGMARDGGDEDGRMGGGGRDGEVSGGEIKFKGRGSMKYRERNRF